MDERYKTYISQTAERDLHSAYEWIAAEAPHRASDWVAGLLAAIDSLEIFPHRCPLAPENDLFEEEIRVHLYRMSSVYRILFTIEANRVVILYIRHGARQYVTPEPPSDDQ